MFYVNPNIKKTERVFPAQGRYGYKRYDMNENPEGLPNDFVNSVLAEITPEFLSIYPEPDKFLEKYAKFIGGITIDNLVATNGSDMGIRYLLETFGEPGKDVVTVSPSFEMYWVNCSILGLRHVPVEYEENLTINVDKIISAITDSTRIVVMLNPNNPIGNVYTEDEMCRIIDRSKEVGAIVIIDEAYHYFYPNTFLSHVINDENVIILRTFSKLFSLAAVRLGVIIGTPEIINYVKKGKLTFDANAIALLFAERIIDRPDIIKSLIESEKSGKKLMVESLLSMNYEFHDCQGNFMFIKTKNNAEKVCKMLEDRNILVHAYKNDLLKDYLRISVGSPKSMREFLDIFYDVDVV